MTLVDITTLGAPEVARVRAIYEDAFPDALRVPFEDLLVDRMLVRVDDSGAAGLALVRDLANDETDTGWTFLRYYAVGRRGGGVGSLMWADLTGLLAAEGRTRLVWDVEDPAEPGLDDAHFEEHRRRIAFYERLGGRLLPVREYAPPHDGLGAIPLLLMDQPLGGAGDVPLRELLEGVYEHRYGVSASHHAVRRTLEASGLT